MMKAVLKKTDLVAATTVVHNMVNPQSSMPILTTILIQAKEGTAHFVASDTESCVRRTVEATVETEGAVTVPARRFNELVRQLPDGDISISTDEENNVLIEGENVHYNLAMMDPEKFPEWPTIESQTQFTINKPDLRRAVESVVFAIPTRDPRRVLLGALFDLKEGKLVTVATDGKKLGYVRQEPVEITGAQDGQSIVPHKVLTEVLRCLGDEGEAGVSLGQRQVQFDLGDAVFVANRIDGTYPNYEMVIPKGFAHTVTLDRAALFNSIRRASIMSDEKNNSVILKINGDKMDITSMTYDVGSFAGSMPVECETDIDMEIVFNHRFLLDVLGIIAEEKVDLKVNKSDSPAVVAGHAAEESLFVVMPIKLADLAQPGEEE